MKSSVPNAYRGQETAHCVSRILNICLILLSNIALLTLSLTSELLRISDDVVVLAYHSVDWNGSIYTVNPTAFHAQIDFLRRNYTIVSLDDIADFVEGKRTLPCKSVAITFDDGYYDNYSRVFPLLKQGRFPATVFLCTGNVNGEMVLGGKPLRMMSWSEIREMNRHNICMGAHTVNHQNLSDLDAEDARVEILQSREDVERETGRDVSYFAYPSSKFNQTLASMVKSLGFRAAFQCGLGSIQLGDDPFALNRVLVKNSTPLFLFRARMTRGGRWYKRFRDMTSLGRKTAVADSIWRLSKHATFSR